MLFADGLTDLRNTVLCLLAGFFILTLKGLKLLFSGGTGGAVARGGLTSIIHKFFGR